MATTYEVFDLSLLDLLLVATHNLHTEEITLRVPNELNFGNREEIFGAELFSLGNGDEGNSAIERK